MEGTGWDVAAYLGKKIMTNIEEVNRHIKARARQQVQKKRSEAIRRNDALLNAWYILQMPLPPQPLGLSYGQPATQA
jgi:hypothetical protein